MALTPNKIFHSAIFLFVFLFSSPAFSQEKSTIKVKRPSDTLKKDSVKVEHELDDIPNTIFYGYQTFDLSILNAGLFQNGNSFTAQHLIYGMEIASYNLLLSRSRGIYACSSVSYARINPQKISDSPTSAWTFSGFRFHVINLGRDIIPQSKLIDLIVFLGLDYGRFILDYENEDGTKYKYKDPFLCVNGMSQLTIKLIPRHPKITIGARAGYDYDLGNPRWIGMKGSGPHIPGTQMRGYYYAGIISYHFY
jgi:hypothetical protein